MNISSAEQYYKDKQSRKVGYMTLDYDSHPFEDTQCFTTTKHKAIHLCADSKCFIENAHRWRDGNPQHKDIHSAIEKCVKLFCYFSQKIGAGKTMQGKPRQLPIFEDCKNAENRSTCKKLSIILQGSAADIEMVRNNDGDEAGEAGSDGSDEDTQDEEAAQGEDGGGGNKKNKKNKKRKKPSKKKNKLLMDFGDILLDLFLNNEKRTNKNEMNRAQGKVDRNAAKAQDLPFVYSLTRQDYVALCSFYTRRHYSESDVQGIPLSDRSNPVHPENVFSLENCLMLAAASGCNGEYYNADNYYLTNRDYHELQQQRMNALRGDPDRHIPEVTRFRFPHPENTYRIKLEYMNPDTIDKFYWPCVRPPAAVCDSQKEEFLKSVATLSIREQQVLNGTADPPILAHESLCAQDKKRRLNEAAFVYDQNKARHGVDNGGSYTVEDVKKRHKMRVDDATRQAGNDKGLLIDLLEQARKESLSDFTVFFSVDGPDTPDAIKAIANYMNEYLSEHSSFCLELGKHTRNLNRFEDEIIMLFGTLETLLGVDTRHKELLCLMFKNMFVYSNSPFGPHTINSGGPGGGKSKMFNLLMDLLIEGTYSPLTYMTDKALVLPGNQFQFKLQFLDDAQPSVLGFTGGGNGNKNSTTSNSDREAIIKAMLTSGQYNAMIRQNKDGISSITIQALINTVFNANVNSSSSDLASSITDRTHNNTYTNRKRIGGAGIMNNMSKKKLKEIMDLISCLTIRFRRNQALIAVVFLLIYCDILPEIDIEAANVIFINVIDKAASMGLKGTSEFRNFERLQMVCKVLVVWDAIGLMWDSPLSPFKGVPHQMEHFLLVAPYLRATVDHAVMTLGLMSNQFEDDIIKEILVDLKDTRFDKEKEEVKDKKREEKERREMHRKEKEIVKEQKGKNAKIAQAPDQTMIKEHLRHGDNSVRLKGQPAYAEEVVEDGEDTNTTLKRGFDDTHPDYYSNVFTLKSGGRTDSNHERIQALARIQYAKMKCKPQFKDLVAAYETLTQTHITCEGANENDVNAPTIPALDFKNGRILLSKKILDVNCDDVLLKCVRYVLNHKHARKAEYLYCNTIPNAPFIFQTIKVGYDNEKDKKKLVELTMKDPDFQDPSLIKSTQRLLMGVAKQHHKKMKCDVDFTEMVDKAFSKKPIMIVDTDLNVYAHAKHLSSIDIHADYIDGLPPGDPQELKKKLIDIADEEGWELIHYPKALPQSKPKRYLKDLMKKVNDDREAYTLSNHMREKGMIPPALIEDNHNGKDEISSVTIDSQMDEELEAVIIGQRQRQQPDKEKGKEEDDDDDDNFGLSDDDKDIDDEESPTSEDTPEPEPEPEPEPIIHHHRNVNNNNRDDDEEFEAMTGISAADLLAALEYEEQNENVN